MKILLSSFVPWWNAEAAYAAILAEELLSRGHEVWLLTQPGTINTRELKRRRLPIVTDIPPTGYNPLGWGRGIAALKAFQRKHGIQIVNVFRSAEFLMHAIAARNTPGLRVIRTRGTARRVRGGWLNRKIYQDLCHALVASSQAVRSQMCHELQIPKEKISIIYYPVDLPPLPSQAQRAEGKKKFLEELKAAPDRLVMGMVGRISPEKGHDSLLQAMTLLIKKTPHVLLVIVAKPQYEGVEGDLPRLEQLVRASCLSSQVRFLGVRQDLREMMGWMDLGVIPSISSEMNCRVAVEFFSMGTPVVAFPTGALPEVVEDGVSGLIVPSHHPEDLAVSLERLVTDEPLRERLGRGARQSAEERFSRARFLEETLAVFESALASP